MDYEKVVINAGYGGFDLSEEAKAWMEEHKTHDYEEQLSDCEHAYDERKDPLLVACVETLGNRASGKYGSLVVQKAPKNAWTISEYDGNETLEYCLRTSDFDFQKWVFRDDMTPEEKIAQLKHHYQSQNILSEMAWRLFSKFDEENEEAKLKFHRIRLGLAEDPPIK